jgi:hypothetical protein
MTGGLRVFDLKREEWLPQLKGHSLVEQQREANLLLFRSSDRGHSVYDLSNKRITSTFATDVWTRVVRFANAASIAVMSHGELVTVRMVDARTGETTHLHRPFAWVQRTVNLLVVGYIPWCFAWIIVSSRGRQWAWVDAVLVGGIPLTLFTARVVLVGDTLEPDRVPYQYSLGIIVAGVMLSIIWVVFGTTRLTLRVLPLAMALAGVGALLAFVFADDSELAWRAIATTAAPSLTFFLPLSVLRMFGWKLRVGTSRPTRFCYRAYAATGSPASVKLPVAQSKPRATRSR